MPITFATRICPDNATTKGDSLDAAAAAVDDVRLLYVQNNHYLYGDGDNWIDVPPDGNCFFHAAFNALGRSNVNIPAVRKILEALKNEPEGEFSRFRVTDDGHVEAGQQADKHAAESKSEQKSATAPVLYQTSELDSAQEFMRKLQHNLDAAYSKNRINPKDLISTRAQLKSGQAPQHANSVPAPVAPKSVLTSAQKRAKAAEADRVGAQKQPKQPQQAGSIPPSALPGSVPTSTPSGARAADADMPGEQAPHPQDAVPPQPPKQAQQAESAPPPTASVPSSAPSSPTAADNDKANGRRKAVVAAVEAGLDQGNTLLPLLIGTGVIKSAFKFNPDGNSGILFKPDGHTEVLNLEQIKKRVNLNAPRIRAHEHGYQYQHKREWDDATSLYAAVNGALGKDISQKTVKAMRHKVAEYLDRNWDRYADDFKNVSLPKYHQESADGAAHSRSHSADSKHSKYSEVFEMKTEKKKIPRSTSQDHSHKPQRSQSLSSPRLPDDIDFNSDIFLLDVNEKKKQSFFSRMLPIKSASPRPVDSNE
ncbi:MULTISPECIES: hypothetical protein [unclassified Undibacterium]|uniref:hypothetical protein n=1 Tax=unclassified Undibacterium TaxID=2630295 RepID=UPI002AC967E3|nr:MULTISPECIES: hypothetical protein [unclassified Undibacterium]MEB0141237.1 hypothetical protein [Undibacterium sp. CCC2.1]MEB0174302.1 hypothetical protein [Undibacterium sp. CCC1.1]MEB0178245.1 hypothetical protein [Undibacterium sp. CCC3.4]MEB0217443.1 hypothetical protein [Undibacterium sp. 5I2]WPX43466.1 hypothetical protein RHM61_19175 [Undibacterium sp. CCC3.4]